MDEKLINESLDRIAARRGVPFSDGQRESLFELANDPFWQHSMSDASAEGAEERDQLVEGMLRMALLGSGESLPVPPAITLEVLNATPVDELPNVLYDFICDYLSETGAYEGGRYRPAILGLPFGLRVIFLLYALDGEIDNGGFSQFFTNSSGEYVPETLDVCTQVGCEQRRQLLERANAVWEPARQKMEAMEGDRDREDSVWEPLAAALEKFTSEYYRVEGTEPLIPLITKYLQSHPEEFLLDGPATRRSGSES